MKDSNHLLDQIEQKIEQSKNSSLTEAGHHKASSSSTELSGNEKEQLIDAINQSFELLRLNYHHLYWSAYEQVSALNTAKRLWMENLSEFQPHTILRAVNTIIKRSDYLPTLSHIVRACTELSGDTPLPSARNAYIEACNARSPKTNAQWSHPAVYYAGKKSDWYFLANNTEKVAFPVFKSHYEKLCQQLMDGTVLPEITPLALPQIELKPLSKDENLSRMQAMRETLGI